MSYEGDEYQNIVMSLPNCVEMATSTWVGGLNSIAEKSEKFRFFLHGGN